MISQILWVPRIQMPKSCHMDWARQQKNESTHWKIGAGRCDTRRLLGPALRFPYLDFTRYHLLSSLAFLFFNISTWWVASFCLLLKCPNSTVSETKRSSWGWALILLKLQQESVRYLRVARMNTKPQEWCSLQLFSAYIGRNAFAACRTVSPRNQAVNRQHTAWWFLHFHHLVPQRADFILRIWQWARDLGGRCISPLNTMKVMHLSFPNCQNNCFICRTEILQGTSQGFLNC